MTTAQPKLFRDPVHDIISFDQNDPQEMVLFELINTPAFQRLRRVRQLGMSFLVYHGAEHTRFTHSMGVCHLALRIHDHLFAEGKGGDRLALGAAALLHDVGHGPFSHVMEQVSGIHHETITMQVISDRSTNVHQVMASVDPTLPERVALILTGQHPCRALTDIVSSQLDADRLDYILRDGLATGVKIGNYDLARIIGMLQVVDDSMVINDRALEAVEGYLLARFHMYKQVYLHKASRSAERMLQATILRVRELWQEGYTFDYYPDGTPLDRVLQGESLTVQEHCQLDDTDLWHAFKKWANEKDPILSELASGLMQRDLFKTIEIDPNDPRGPAGAMADARQAVQKAGDDPRYHLLVDSSRDTPYRPYQIGMSDHPIRILDRRGNVSPIEQRSAIVRLMGENAHETVRLCVPKRLKARIAPIAGPEGAPSLI